jgi:hypothetical protein
LYWAADAGRFATVETLLANGANPNLIDLEMLGKSGFKPNFTTPEEYATIKKRIVDARSQNT